MRIADAARSRPGASHLAYFRQAIPRSLASFIRLLIYQVIIRIGHALYGDDKLPSGENNCKLDTFSRLGHKYTGFHFSEVDLGLPRILLHRPKYKQQRESTRGKKLCDLICLGLWGKLLFHSPGSSLLRGGPGGALSSTALASIGRGAGSLTGLLLGDTLGLLALLRGGSRAAGANGTDNDQDRSEEKSHETTGHLGHGLDGVDRVLLGQAHEVVDLLADKGDGVLLEANGGALGRLLGLGLLGLFLSRLDGVLDIKGLLAELLSILDGVTNVHVVEQNVALHGPDLETDGAHGLEVGGGLVLEVVGVGNLAGGPRTLVGRVVNHGSGPLALVLGVLLHGASPLAAARGIGALGVGDSGRDPVTILLVIPVLGLLGLGVGDAGGLVLQPVSGLLSLLVQNLERSLLIPVLGLGSLRVSDLDLVDPVGGLLVLGVVNLLLGVDGRGEVLQKASLLDGLAVDQHLEGLVRVHDQSVEGGDLVGAGHGGSLEVLLLILAGLGVLVTEDEVDLDGLSVAEPQW